ncbi:hypothetical protein NHJ13734_001142 [Beauveria thailandica]
MRTRISVAGEEKVAAALQFMPFSSEVESGKMKRKECLHICSRLFLKFRVCI